MRNTSRLLLALTVGMLLVGGSLAQEPDPVPEPLPPPQDKAPERQPPPRLEIPSELRDLGKWRPFEQQQQMYVEDGRIMFMTPAEYARYQEEKKVRQQQFRAAEVRWQAESKARASQASEKLYGYAIGFVIAALIGVLRCESWVGRLIVLVICLGLAAFLFITAEEGRRRSQSLPQVTPPPQVRFG